MGRLLASAASTAAAERTGAAGDGCTGLLRGGSARGAGGSGADEGNGADPVAVKGEAGGGMLTLACWLGAGDATDDGSGRDVAAGAGTALLAGWLGAGGCTDDGGGTATKGDGAGAAGGPAGAGGGWAGLGVTWVGAVTGA